jgi:alpha-beta hydrolase superfamily lysophospholipase
MAIELLLIGDMAVAIPRLNELRLRGYATWLATTEAELTWLLEKATARPSHAIVDLSTDSPERAWVLGSRAAVAALAQLPTILVGAQDDEVHHFQRVIAFYPTAPTTDELIRALKT